MRESAAGETRVFNFHIRRREEKCVAHTKKRGPARTIQWLCTAERTRARRLPGGPRGRKVLVRHKCIKGVACIARIHSVYQFCDTRPQFCVKNREISKSLMGAFYIFYDEKAPNEKISIFHTKARSARIVRVAEHLGAPIAFATFFFRSLLIYLVHPRCTFDTPSNRNRSASTSRQCLLRNAPKRSKSATCFLCLSHSLKKSAFSFFT